jgi:hypothetical protein
MFLKSLFLIASLSLLTYGWATQSSSACSVAELIEDSRENLCNYAINYNFSNPDPQVQLLTGFSHFEHWGAWTVGGEATFSISIPKDKFLNQESILLRNFFCSFSIIAHIPREDSKIEAEFIFSGTNEPYSVTREFSARKSSRTLFFPLDSIEITDTLNVKVKIRGFSAPADHSSSSDRRLLGLGFKKGAFAFNAIEGFSNEYFAEYITPSTHPQNDFINGPVGIQDITDEQVIVSLTSWPPRIHLVYCAIESLMRQTYKPSKICLFLAESQFPDHKIPRTLEILQTRGLEVHFCDDWGPAKKLIPAMEKFPSATIITVDDDVAYDSDLIEDLMKAHKQHPASIIGNRFDKILFEEDKTPKYVHPIRTVPNKSVLIATGIGGVLYPPFSLDSEAFNLESYRELCFYGDDIWFLTMAILKGTKVNSSNARPCHFRDIDEHDLRKVALWNQNGSGRNNIMLENVFKKYGIYDKLEFDF